MQDAKKSMRAGAIERRKVAHARQGSTAGEAIAAHGLSFLEPPLRKGMIVSGFSAIGEEIDASRILSELHAYGYRTALPVIQGKGSPLLFRAWTPGDRMQARTWGIAEPLDTEPVLEPDVLLVPLLAYDARGYRLGYGGGFYDRTLEVLRNRKPVIAIGVAYAEQRVDAVPHSDYDQRLDWVLTPSGPFKCSRH